MRIAWALKLLTCAGVGCAVPIAIGQACGLDRTGVILLGIVCGYAAAQTFIAWTGE